MPSAGSRILILSFLLLAIACLSLAAPSRQATPDPEIDRAETDAAYEKASKEIDNDFRKANEKDGGKNCFPYDATVERFDGNRVRMDELRVGDRVRVAPGAGPAAFSQVFLFTHADAGYTSGNFVRVSAGGRALTAAPGHFVYKAVEGERAGAVAVESLRVGDMVLLAGAAVKVEKVQRVHGKGLYNPQTVQGDIVVDGFLATTYTSAVRPRVAHALLAPVRAVYAALGVDMSEAFEVCAGYIR